jgi:hypothetical protein
MSTPRDPFLVSVQTLGTDTGLAVYCTSVAGVFQLRQSLASLSLPAEFSLIGAGGAYAGTWVNQNANRVFAGPASGAAATPAFRALVDDDIPASARLVWTKYTVLYTQLQVAALTNTLTLVTPAADSLVIGIARGAGWNPGKGNTVTLEVGIAGDTALLVPQWSANSANYPSLPNGGSNIPGGTAIQIRAASNVNLTNLSAGTVDIHLGVRPA